MKQRLTTLVSILKGFLALWFVTVTADSDSGFVIPKTCTEKYFMSPVDHFSVLNHDTYPQRYFVCTPEEEPEKYQAIFFYAGNEATIESYMPVNGLLLENLEAFQGIGIFSEHRFYGRSFPSRDLKLNSVYQAILDHVGVVKHVQATLQKKQGEKNRLPTIVFGGSYGGVLAAFLRAKHSDSFDGAIAASAPFKLFSGIQKRPISKETYWEVVTNDAKKTNGCAETVRMGFDSLIHTPERLKSQLGDIFKLCPLSRKKLEEDKNFDFIQRIAIFLAMAWDNMAMSDFPFENNFLTGDPKVSVSAFPINTACQQVLKPAEDRFSQRDASLMALERAASVLYNASKKEKCYEIPPDDSYGDMWDVMVCQENIMQDSWFPMNGETDMFFKREYTTQMLEERCQKKFGFSFNDTTKDELGAWARDEFFPFDEADAKNFVPKASKIVFSNGDLDPWSAGGINYNSSEAEIYSVLVKGGAHHLDLFGSNEVDGNSVKEIRQFELMMIRKWIQDFHQKHATRFEVEFS